MESTKQIFIRGIFKENTTFVMFLGLCPTLATTNNLTNALGMGISVLIVLSLSNTIISIFRKIVPNEIRIPFYITIIATIVTLLQIVLSIAIPSIYESLGIYLPLIVVNCIVLGRAESFASKNNSFQSLLDGVAVGIGFLLALALLGTFRELVGTGAVSLLNVRLFSQESALAIITQPAGAFLMFGILAWIINTVKAKKEAK